MLSPDHWLCAKQYHFALHLIRDSFTIIRIGSWMFARTKCTFFRIHEQKTDTYTHSAEPIKITFIDNLFSSRKQCSYNMLFFCPVLLKCMHSYLILKFFRSKSTSKQNKQIYFVWCKILYFIEAVFVITAFRIMAIFHISAYFVLFFQSKPIHSNEY